MNDERLKMRLHEAKTVVAGLLRDLPTWLRGAAQSAVEDIAEMVDDGKSLDDAIASAIEEIEQGVTEVFEGDTPEFAPTAVKRARIWLEKAK